MDLQEGQGADAPTLAAFVAARRSPGATYVIGLTGSVASGKSTLAAALVAALAEAHALSAELVGADGFLFPNSVLAAQDLLGRKGFPETYDSAAMARAIASARTGPAEVPIYSHVLYDIDPSQTRRFARPDVLVLEGLGLPPAGAVDLLDLFIYLDADEADLARWFLARFRAQLDVARTDPSSFYVRFLALSPEQADAFALDVWEKINLANLRAHIAPLREVADLVLRKDADHALQAAAVRARR
ncbi:MAG: type I pantothenate kinase [Alphaproteobacteria bacterium]|nr:type I pantothenate kinase [Alphaproteobacteria bacterium]